MTSSWVQPRVFIITKCWSEQLFQNNYWYERTNAYELNKSRERKGINIIGSLRIKQTGFEFTCSLGTGGKSDLVSVPSLELGQ